MNVRILFEDDDLIAVDKPPGLPTHATVDPKRDNLAARVRSMLAQRPRELSAEVYLGEHHRLDRDTSGAIIFSKTKRANPGLAHAFKAHEAAKTYLALTAPFKRAALGPEHRSWQARNYLADDGKSGRVRAVHSGGKAAITDFELAAHSSHGCLVIARPLTGRRHQIRVHLADAAAPILGDETYSAAPSALAQAQAPPRLMLHAWKLALPHPITSEPLEILAPIPADFLAFARRLGIDAEGACES